MIIDGRRVDPEPGWSVLDAARQAGVTVPTLCHHPALPPEGSCRLCVVEVEGRPGVHPACVLPAADDLVVHTGTDQVQATRRHVLRLLLRRYRPAIPPTDDELLALASQHGLAWTGPADEDVGELSWRTRARGRDVPPAHSVDETNPIIHFDEGACVRCWRCVRACRLLNGVGAIGVFGRGEDACVGFGAGQPMHESRCEFCGMCASVCPTHALAAQPDGAIAAAPEAATSTVCGYCGVGCRLALHVAKGRIVSTGPDWEGPANRGLACVKGRFGWRYVHHPDRLTRPLVRSSLLGGAGPGLVETDWDTALDLVARGLVGIARRHGPDAVGLLASAKCTNEENYLFQKLARQLLATNNVDHCARLCHAPTVAALGEALGSGAMTNSMDDIAGQAQLVLIVGSNTTGQHPVLGMRLRRAVRERGIPIVVADPRRTPIADFAALHLPLRPGTDVALLNAIAHELLRNGWIDRPFVAGRTENLDAFVESVQDQTPEWAAGVTGVAAADIRRAARLLWEHRPGALLYAMGVTQHTSGTANAFACVNLQLLLGNVGVPGGGVNPLRGQNNVQGACDMGALPDFLPGYQRVVDPRARAAFENAWGTALPRMVGLTVTEMLDAALAGRIRGLWILGENAAMTDPDLTHVRRCLSAAELLVVQDIFPSETARHAHVVLPAAASVERAGTFTSTERRVQRFEAAVDPPADARPDWWVVAEVARRVIALRDAGPPAGSHAGWSYASPADVMREIAALAPIYGGIAHDRLGRQGLQWPCPAADHPGTPILHVGRFSRGRGRFTPVRHTAPAETADAEYPLVLTTGRVLEHYHGGTMTRRVQALDWLVPEAVAEIHPEDAARYRVGDGDRVELRSRRGAISLTAHVTRRIVRGTVFVPFHFAEAAANVLTNAALDPLAKIPEYKVCAVALEPAGPTGELRTGPGRRPRRSWRR